LAGGFLLVEARYMFHAADGGMDEGMVVASNAPTAPTP
jgi:hypothetical protein